MPLADPPDIWFITRHAWHVLTAVDTAMLSWLRKLAGRRTAADQRRDNPVVERAVQDAAVIYSEIPLRALIDEERREQLARELYLEINRICNSPDPATACREQLVATMLWVASYQVLIIPPAPEPDASGLRGKPGITGELKAHLVELCQADDELRSFVHQQTEARDFETLSGLIERRYWEAVWLLRTIDATRRALGDDRDDWFEPFMHAACANQENAYRWALELPSVLPEKSGGVVAATYAVFADIVLSNAEDPLAEWRAYAGQ